MERRGEIFEKGKLLKKIYKKCKICKYFSNFEMKEISKNVKECCSVIFKNTIEYVPSNHKLSRCIKGKNKTP